jgi:hypothetical protein
LEAARANNVVLRLLSESAAHASCQLVCLHGVENGHASCQLVCLHGVENGSLVWCRGRVRAAGQRHVHVGPLIPRSDLHAWARLSRRRKLLVRTGSQRWRLLVWTSSRRRGGDYLCEQVVGVEAETTHANRLQVGDRTFC